MEIEIKKTLRDDKREHFAKWVGLVVMHHQEIMQLTKIIHFRLSSALINPELLLSERQHPQFVSEKQERMRLSSDKERLRIFASEALAQKEHHSFDPEVMDAGLIEQLASLLNTLEQTLWSEFLFSTEGKLVQKVDRSLVSFKDFGEHLGFPIKPGFADVFSSPLKAENRLRNAVVHSIYDADPDANHDTVIVYKVLYNKQNPAYSVKKLVLTDKIFIKIIDGQISLTRNLLAFSELITDGISDVLKNPQRKNLRKIIQALNSIKWPSFGIDFHSEKNAANETIMFQALDPEIFSIFHLEADTPEASENENDDF
jgi:hypothetical protein